MSELDQATRPDRHADAARPVNETTASRSGLPPGLPPGAEIPPLVPDHEADESSVSPRHTPAALRLAAGVTAVAVLGALVIGVSNRSVIGETPPQQPGVGAQVAAAERANADVPAVDQQAASGPDSLTSLVVELEGSGAATLTVSTGPGVETREVALPFRGALALSGASTGFVTVIATARSASAQLRCRLFSSNRLVRTASSPGRVDCSIRHP